MFRGISYKAVLSRLKFNWQRLPVADLDADIITGINLLGLSTAKIPKICTVYSCDGIARMPDDLRERSDLRFVAYKYRNLTKPLVESQCSCHKIKADCIDDTSVLKDDYDPHRNTSEIIFDNPFKNGSEAEDDLAAETKNTHDTTCPSVLLSDYMRIAYRQVNRGVMFHPELNYFNFLESKTLYETWKLLRYTDLPIPRCTKADNECAKFNFDGCGNIRFELCRDVIVMFGYIGEQTNELNELLIPESEDVIEALVFYVTMCYWERQKNALREGANAHYQEYKTMWLARKQAVQGSANLPSVAQGRRLKAMLFANMRYAEQYSAYNVGGRYLNLPSYI